MRKYDGKRGQMGHYKVFNDVRFKYLHKKQIYRFHKHINCSRLVRVDSRHKIAYKRSLVFPGNIYGYIYYIYIYRIYTGRNYGGEQGLFQKKSRFRCFEKVTTLLIYGTVVGSPRYSESVFGVECSKPPSEGLGVKPTENI